MHRTGRKSAVYRTRNIVVRRGRRTITSQAFSSGTASRLTVEEGLSGCWKRCRLVVLRLRLLSFCRGANCDVGLRVVYLRFCKHLALLYLLIASKPCNKADLTWWTCSAVCVLKRHVFCEILVNFLRATMENWLGILMFGVDQSESE